MHMTSKGALWAALITTFFSAPLRAASPANGPPVMTRMPMVMDLEQTAASRQLAKQVLASRLLDDMEEKTHWSHHGYGKMEFTRQRAIDGEHSLSLVSPTLSSKPTSGRPMGTAVVRHTVPKEDWQPFNRLSFWVFPTQPGVRVLSMGIAVHVALDSAPNSPHETAYFHYFLLEPQRWNHIVWEIPHLVRQQVEAIEFHYRIRGREPGVASSVRFDIDHLELQRVKADYFEGWAVAPGRIATSHTGYASGAKKTAISSTLTGGTFQLHHADTGEVVLTKPIQEVHASLGDFQILDFSEVRQPGNYLIRAAGAPCAPIRIQPNVWLETIWKTLNFFYCQRCGTEIPEIHATCHRDLRAAHADQQIVINGGWHDAGDLSQGLTNTAQATGVMFHLAEHFRKQDPALAARLMEEARWGLDWLLKTRFGDGSRAVWATMDLWSDGILGNMDDIVWEAGNSPQGNLLAATAEASASRLLRQQNPRLAAQALQAAQQDWRFATEAISTTDLQTAAFVVNAALALHGATGNSSYAAAAFQHAQTILACQQQRPPPWHARLTGFFYTATDQRHIVHHSHASHEQAPIVALAQLCETFPSHPDWIEWYAGVVLYSEYLRTASAINEPYRITPASIYSLGESQNADFLDQVRNGFPLGKTHFLRRFPVWHDLTYRGNNPVLLAQAKALSVAARLRRDPSLLELAQNGMEWVVGKNPFAQSLMAGEGFDNQSLYSPTSGDIVGALPVGIKTHFNRDVPYWPSETNSCFKEVWVHPATHWLSLMSDLAEFSDRDELVPADDPHANRSVSPMFSLSQETGSDGTVSITVTVAGVDSVSYSVRAANLQSKHFEGRIVLQQNQPASMVWLAKMKSIDEPWVAVFIPDEDLSKRQEIVGFPQAPELK